MGQALVNFYSEVDKIGQMKAKMRMAMLTGVSSVKADMIPDTPEMITKFKTAFEEIKKEFK
jgi:ABC-type molybdate transport system permease subunit